MEIMKASGEVPQEMLAILISRWLGLIGTSHGLLTRILLSSMASRGGGSTNQSRWRSIGLAGKHTIARGATATTAAAALAAAAAAAASTTRAVAVVRVDKGRHLTLSILQHDTVVVIKGDSRIRGPMGLNVVPVSGTGPS